MQRTIVATLNKVTNDSFLANCSDHDRKRMRALRHPNAARVLTVVPTTPSLRLSDTHMRITVKYRLGASPVDSKTIPRFCGCGQGLTDNPYHGVSCSRHRRSRLIQRHDGVKMVIAAGITKSGNHCRVEPREYNADMTKKLRPDFVCTLGASTIAGDVQIVNPLAPSNSRLDNAMAAAVQRKRNKYGQAFSAQVNTFAPLLFETYGGFDTGSLNFVAHVSNESTLCTKEETLNYLVNEIAVAIARGNAHCILSCFNEGVHDRDQPQQQPPADNDGAAAAEHAAH